MTERATGLDLVEWPLRAAVGAPLPLQQPDIHLTGHAIEVQFSAEDPYNGFAPQTGPVQFWRPELALAGRTRGGMRFWRGARREMASPAETRQLLGLRA